MHRDLENAIIALKSPNQNFVSTRDALKKLLVLDNQDVDIQSSMKYVVRVLPLQDHVIKKLACNLISRLSFCVSGTGLLVHNTLSTELRDPNPSVRALALRTLCQCCDHPDDALGPVATALDDTSPYVRRAAVLACVRLTRRASDGDGDGCSVALVHQLYSAIRDLDPLVVGNALVALDQVLGTEGGAVINRNIARHLSSRLTSLDEWSVTHALNALTRYSPADDDHLFRLLDTVDPFLRHANCSVSIAATRLFLHFLTTSTISSGLDKLSVNKSLLDNSVLDKSAFDNSVLGNSSLDKSSLDNSALNNSSLNNSALDKSSPTRDLRPDVYRRVLPRLATALTDSTHPELIRLVLQFIQKQLDNTPSTVFAQLSNSLLCKYGEPDDIKVVKIRLLAEVMTPSAGRVLDEIAMYSTSATSCVSQAAIQAVGRVAARSEENPVVLQQCLTRLLALLTLERGDVSGWVLAVLGTLNLSRSSDGVGLARALSDCAGRMSVLDGGAPALVYLLGEWGGQMEDAPYILERFGEQAEGRIRLNLLEATVKLFFRRPAECQVVLGRLLERCWNDEDGEVRRSAVYYYRLLGHDVQLARRIVEGTNAGFATCSTELDGVH